MGRNNELELDFSVLDRVLNMFVKNNCRPIVELGFMPDDLSKGPRPKPRYDYGASDLWMYPPKDYPKWQELVYETVKHAVAKYGKEEVSAWYWELWNEPDNPGFFKGSIKDYCKMYDYAVAGAVAALEPVRIGGPGLASNPKFLQKFLKHCAGGKNYVTGERGSRLDFISFHAKGTGWPLHGQPFEMPSLQLILSHLESYAAVLQRFPQYRNTPILFDECDMAVATNYGVYDFPEFEMNNTEYYPIFVIRMAKAILDFIAEHHLPIRLFTTWAFYFEGKRFFEGNRALVTNENIKKPVFNAFAMLEKMGGTRLRLRSDKNAKNAHVDGLASLHPDGAVSVIIWNFVEESGQAGEAERVQLLVKSLTFTSREITVERFQIDAKHSNAYACWHNLGEPQDPTKDEIARMRKSADLELLEKREIDVVEGTVEYEFDLPLPGVCLLRFSAISSHRNQF
ncbi:MAG: hypothetical protein ACE5IR_26255 [bacterium]